jgi:hypothetical protein
MLNKVILLLILLSCSLCAQVVESDDALRGAFFRTRKEQMAQPKTKSKSPAGTGKTTAKNSASQPTQEPPNAPMILGYTLFKKGGKGKPLVVESTTIFKEGDALRFAVEANCEGFLYIFTQENTGDVRMLFPSPA